MTYTDDQIAAYTPEQLDRSIYLDQPDGTRRYLFIPSDLQAEIMASRATNLFVYGNRGGGKSVAIRWMCHMLAMSIPNFRYAILRTSFPELLKNHINYLDGELEAFGGEKAGFKYNRQEHQITYPKGSIGYYAQCKTDDDVKKVLGAEVALVVFDEAPTFQWDHMRLIAASVRVTKGSGLKPMVRYLGNPVGDSIDELWKYFIDKEVDPAEDPDYNPDDWQSIEIRMEDNIHLDLVAYKRQFAGLPEHYRKAWLEGVRHEERTLFRFEPTRGGQPWHVIPEMPTLGGVSVLQLRWIKVLRGYDHGYFPDPAYALWVAVIGKRLIAFKEKIWFRETARDIARDIVNETPRDMSVATTYCDPTIDIKTGADVVTIRDQMEMAGVPMTPSINNRVFYAHAIHSVLQETLPDGGPRIQFLASGCPYLIKYLPRMKYDEHNTLALADHPHDHPAVTLAYILLSAMPETQPMETFAPRKWMQKKKKRSSAYR